MAGWAAIVCVAYQLQHPLPWQAWRGLILQADWAALVPSASAIAASGGRLLGVAFIVAAAACGGGRLLAGITGGNGFLTHATTSERFWCAALTGLALLAGAAILLAATQLLYPAVLVGVMLGMVLVGAPDTRRWFWPVRPAVGQSNQTGIVERGCKLFIALVFVGALPIALSPQVLHDSQVYHLSLPQTYLRAHGFVRLPHLVFANTPLNGEMLYTYALVLGGPPTAKLLHMVCALGMLSLTVALGQRLCDARVGWLAAVCTLAVPVVVGQLPTSYVDLAAGFAFVGGIWGLCRWADTAHVGFLRFGWLALGLFAGMRYTSVYGIAAAIILTASILLRDRASTAEWLRAIAIAAAGLGLGAGPWLLKNFAQVGNPVFPIATSLFGLGPLTATQHARTQLLVAEHGMGHGLGDLALLPWRVTVLGNPGYATFDGAVSPVWLAAAPAILCWLWSSSSPRRLGLVAVAFPIAWGASTHVVRYLIPVMPLWSVLAVGSVSWLLCGRKSAARCTRRLAVLAGVAATGVWWVPAVVPTLVSGPLAFGPAAWGHESRDAFLFRREQTAPVFAYMERELPADARVIGLWENRAFRCPRPLDGDGVYEAPRWLDIFAAAEDLSALASALQREGYSHVLLNHVHLERYPPRAVSERDAAAIQEGLARMRAFLREECVERFEARGITLYEIRPGPAAEP